MSDAFTDVAKMKKNKEDIKAHEGQMVEMKGDSRVKLPTPMWSPILTQIF